MLAMIRGVHTRVATSSVCLASANSSDCPKSPISLVSAYHSVVKYFECHHCYFIIITIWDSRCQDPSQNRTISHPFARSGSFLPQFPKGAGAGSWGPRQTGVQAGCFGNCLMSILDEIKDYETVLLPLLPCPFEKEPKPRKNNHS